MGNSNFQSYKRRYHYQILFDILLWAASFIILLFSFNQSDKPTKIDYIYTISFLSTIIIPVFINIYFLIPYFLKRERYMIYGFFFLLNLIVFLQLNVLFFDQLIDYLFPDYYFISYHSNTKLVTIFSIFLIGFTLLKLSEDWFYFNRDKNRELKIQNQQIQSQLISLRSQINPHFLFNSLNVIYSLALEKKDETTHAIVQLSDILRYVIYDSNKKRVLLKHEITLLEKYIEFQKHRHHLGDTVQFNQDIKNKEFQIYPMLLLPFLENSFKHGIKGDTKNTFIDLDIALIDNEFLFIIENNYTDIEPITKNEYTGIGIENIRKNLKIVYPNKHVLSISKTQNRFKVFLKLINDEN